MLFFLRSTFAGGGPAGLIEERTTLAITNLKSEQNTNPTSSPKRQNTPEKLLHPPLRIRIRHRPAPDLLQARIRQVAVREHFNDRHHQAAGHAVGIVGLTGALERVAA